MFRRHPYVMPAGPPLWWHRERRDLATRLRRRAASRYLPWYTRRARRERRRGGRGAPGPPPATAGYSFKKTLLASAADRPDLAEARRTSRTGRQPRMAQEPHRLVFVDETGTTTKMTRLRGRARRGERVKASAPFGHWCTQTFIAGLRCDGLTAPWLIDRPMNRQIFE